MDKNKASHFHTIFITMNDTSGILLTNVKLTSRNVICTRHTQDQKDENYKLRQDYIHQLQTMNL